MAVELAQSAIAISTEYGFALELSRSKIAHGRALIHDGHAREGLSEMRQATLDFEKTGAALHGLRSIAGGLLKVGEVEEGLKVVDSLRKNSVGMATDPELARLKGELLLARGSSSARPAEQAMRDAIEEARRMDASHGNCAQQ